MMKADQDRSMVYYRIARYLLLLALFFSIFSMRSSPGLAAEEKTNTADEQLRGRAYALFSRVIPIMTKEITKRPVKAMRN